MAVAISYFNCKWEGRKCQSSSTEGSEVRILFRKTKYDVEVIQSLILKRLKKNMSQDAGNRRDTPQISYEHFKICCKHLVTFVTRILHYLIKKIIIYCIYICECPLKRYKTTRLFKRTITIVKKTDYLEKYAAKKCRRENEIIQR